MDKFSVYFISHGNESGHFMCATVSHEIATFLSKFLAQRNCHLSVGIVMKPEEQ